jgi:NAD(P)-dependent dehydrogenase (short-subunit alcohol dehydrogenase family)
LQRVLVLGGYGAFGGLAAERLAREPDIEVIVAGRSEEKAKCFAAKLAVQAKARVSAARLDAGNVSAAALGVIGPAVLINATGPYQEQDYRVARVCIAAGAHYLDLADARTFVSGVVALDADARKAGVLVVSGASTVPAISGAVVDAHATEFGWLDAVDTVIAPANSFDPGIATTRSILGALGRPLGAPRKAAGSRFYGWQGLTRRRLPGLGGRWLGRCDVPDLDLFPTRYPGLEVVKVYGALEVGAFHLGLWGLSWLVRAGLLHDPQRLAGSLLGVRRRLGFLGSDRSGMAMTLEGRDVDGRPKRLAWHLVTDRGHGPYVPATPSVLVAKKLLGGALARRGAMPCLGLFTLDELLAEIADLDVAVGTAWVAS